MEDGHGEGKIPLEQNQEPLFLTDTLCSCHFNGLYLMPKPSEKLLCCQLGILYSGNPDHVTPTYITAFLDMSLCYSACKHLDC